MNYHWEESALKNVWLLTTESFTDHRGHYIETYNKQWFSQQVPQIEFVQDDISLSHYGVLRGIHGDQKTWKLISCLKGSFFLVVVNNDQTSPNYLSWTSFVMSEHIRRSVLVPPKFGNGHLVLSEWAIFHYKQSSYYDRASQFTLKWNDPSLKIQWPIDKPILSERDT